VSPVKYEIHFYISEDDILYSHRRENLKSYIQTKCSSILQPTDTLIKWSCARKHMSPFYDLLCARLILLLRKASCSLDASGRTRLSAPIIHPPLLPLRSSALTCVANVLPVSSGANWCYGR
jgi:hypothetical protein